MLQRAIQDEQVKRAAQKLVLELVRDPEVHQSLVTLVQRLGRAPEVQRATQSLLLRSAHRSLNDAELLEHSMEFATDVLGDDVVQQTAGEALRNTVGHAVRPAATVVIAATGITLILLGLVALGFARCTDQEVLVLEQAAWSLQTNTALGLMRLVKWPFTKLHELGQTIVATVVYRYQHPSWPSTGGGCDGGGGSKSNGGWSLSGVPNIVVVVWQETLGQVGNHFVAWLTQGVSWLCRGYQSLWQFFSRNSQSTDPSNSKGVLLRLPEAMAEVWTACTKAGHVMATAMLEWWQHWLSSWPTKKSSSSQ